MTRSVPATVRAETFPALSIVATRCGSQTRAPRPLRGRFIISTSSSGLPHPIREFQIVQVENGLRIGLADEAEPVEVIPIRTAVPQFAEHLRGLTGHRDRETPSVVALFAKRRGDFNVNPLAERKGQQLLPARRKFAAANPLGPTW